MFHPMRYYYPGLFAGHAGGHDACVSCETLREVIFWSRNATSLRGRKFLLLLERIGIGMGLVCFMAFALDGGG